MKRWAVVVLVLTLGLACRTENKGRNADENGTPTTAESDTAGTAAVTSNAEPCADETIPPATTVAATDTVHGPWERPMTLESAGTDPVIPCACVTIHPNSRNATTEEAFQNLIAVANTGRQTGMQPTTAVVVGHGENGGLCTGDGEKCNEAAGNKMIGSTILSWAATAATLKQSGITTLRFLGCGVGAGAIGKKFVHDVANATGLIVLAPDCLLHCEKGRYVALVQGGSWYDSRTPLPPPPAPSAPSAFVLVHIGGILHKILWSDVIASRFEDLDRTKLKHFEDHLDRQIAEQIAFDRPFHVTGEPFGIVTGSITLNFKSNAPKKYTIYGDVAARDPDDPSTFYPVSPWLSDRFLMPN